MCKVPCGYGSKTVEQGECIGETLKTDTSVHAFREVCGTCLASDLSTEYRK